MHLIEAGRRSGYFFADRNGFHQKPASAIRRRGDRAVLIAGELNPTGPLEARALLLGNRWQRESTRCSEWLRDEKIQPDHIVLSADGRSAVRATADALALAQGSIRSGLNLNLWFLTERTPA